MVQNKSKRDKRKRPTSKKYQFYKIEGDKIIREGKSCPRCGPGVFLADSDNRLYCGRCHYTEFSGKNDKITGEQKKPEVKDTEEE